MATASIMSRAARARFWCTKKEVAGSLPPFSAEGMTLIPLRVYFNVKGVAKLELGLHAERSSMTNVRLKRRETGRAQRRGSCGRRARQRPPSTTKPICVWFLCCFQRARHRETKAPPPASAPPENFRTGVCTF